MPGQLTNLYKGLPPSLLFYAADVSLGFRHSIVQLLRRRVRRHCSLTMMALMSLTRHFLQPLGYQGHFAQAGFLPTVLQLRVHPSATGCVSIHTVSFLVFNSKATATTLHYMSYIFSVIEQSITTSYKQR